MMKTNAKCLLFIKRKKLINYDFVFLVYELTVLQNSEFEIWIIVIANFEEFFKIYESNVHGPEEPHLGLELAGEVDGCQAMGESWCDR